MKSNRSLSYKKGQEVKVDPSLPEAGTGKDTWTVLSWTGRKGVIQNQRTGRKMNVDGQSLEAPEIGFMEGQVDDVDYAKAIKNHDAWLRKEKEKEGNITEGSYRGDLQRLVGSELHIDQHRSKMGEDDDIIVVSFKVQGKEPANDLVSFLETGYDFILDADASPGEISPGRFLVFFELSRRTTAADRIYQIVEEVLNLTLQDMDEWRFAYGPPVERGSRRRVETYPFTKENLERIVPMSPRSYREANEDFEAESFEPVIEPQIDFVAPSPEVPAQDTDDIAAMKNIAQIPVNQTAPDDDEMNSLRQQAGLI